MPPTAPQRPQPAAVDPFAAGFDNGKDAQFFAELSSLGTNAPLDHYFSNLQRVLQKAVNAPVMVVGVKDVATANGFKQRFRRDANHQDGDPSIDWRFIEPALRTAKPVLHVQMPKLPTGGFLQQPADSAGSVMAAPLLVENRVIGYIAVRNPNDGAFDERDLARFTAAANVAALVVRNELTVDEAAARRAELQMMLETARALVVERDLSRFFETFHGLVRGAMDAETFFVALGTWSDGGRMHVQYCVHHHRRVEIAEPLPIKGTASGHVFHEGMPLLLHSKLDFHNYPIAEQGSRDQIQSGIVMPLQNGHRVIGVLCAQSSKPSRYGVRERDLLEVLGELCAIAIETSRDGRALAVNQ